MNGCVLVDVEVHSHTTYIPRVPREPCVCVYAIVTFNPNAPASRKLMLVKRERWRVEVQHAFSYR